MADVNGHGTNDPDEAERQMRMREMTKPKPAPAGYTMAPAKLSAPGMPDIYLVEETIHSTNGEFTFFWDIVSAKQRGAEFRKMAARTEQYQSGLWTPQQQGLIMPPGN
jgi:hypothetical protein